MWSHRFISVRAGVLWTSCLDHLRISSLKSLRFHRFEPVIGIVSPLPWAMLLTRQGISLCSCKSTTYDRFTSSMLCILLLHVAMQMGLYLHRRVSAFGVQSLRILIISVRGLQ